jgi:hypothetical protein
VTLNFGEASDCEPVVWIAGHGGDLNGYAVEGIKGQRLRHAWEDAEANLAEIWDRHSRHLSPQTMPGMVLIKLVIRGGGA